MTIEHMAKNRKFFGRDSAFVSRMLSIDGAMVDFTAAAITTEEHDAAKSKREADDDLTAAGRDLESLEHRHAALDKEVAKLRRWESQTYALFDFFRENTSCKGCNNCIEIDIMTPESGPWIVDCRNCEHLCGHIIVFRGASCPAQTLVGSHEDSQRP